jgi:S-adenosylmethionine hydrolase
MKSRIVLRAPQIPVIDLTHQITPFAPEEAGYWLYCCLPQFPAGTVHVAVVDPGVGSARAIVVLCAAQQCFIAPDNGLLGLLAYSRADAVAYRVEAAALVALQLAPHSATFHGRDIMGPLAAELAAGRVQAAQLGPRHVLEPGRLQPAVREPDGSIRGSVALIDHYGNALTTIAASLLGSMRQVRLQPGGRVLRLVRTYEEAAPGECVALINSASMLELAARQGSAAAQLNVGPGQQVQVS